jgi:predicted molibdopterin-dependent oxidoreductase YjgC
MKRIDRTSRALPAVERGAAVNISIDGKKVTAYAGETIAAVLIANGIRVFRYTSKNHQPRGIYCGMGICFECLVTVDGIADVRTCMTSVRDGMVVETGAKPHAG